MARAAAGVLGPQGVTAMAGQGAGAGFGPTALKLAVEAVRSQSSGSLSNVAGAGAVSGYEPVLSRVVGAAHAERSAAQPISASWEATACSIASSLGMLERSSTVIVKPFW